MFYGKCDLILPTTKSNIHIPTRVAYMDYNECRILLKNLLKLKIDFIIGCFRPMKNSEIIEFFYVTLCSKLSDYC